MPTVDVADLAEFADPLTNIFQRVTLEVKGVKLAKSGNGFMNTYEIIDVYDKDKQDDTTTHKQSYPIADNNRMKFFCVMCLQNA